MNREQLLPTLGFALLLGLVVVAVSSGLRLSFAGPLPSTAAQDAGLPAAATQPEEPAVTAPPPVKSAPPIAAEPAGPLSFALASPVATGVEIEDVLLLADAANPTDFDANFRKIAEFYGLLTRRIDLGGGLSASDLLDTTASPFKLIGISAGNLPALGPDDIKLLLTTIREDGASLLIYDADRQTDARLLSALTGGAVTRVRAPRDSVRNWTVTGQAPEVTREFSGMYIELTEVMPQLDGGLVLASETAATPLVVSRDDFDETYPVFVQVPVGAGHVYVNAGRTDPETDINLERVPLRLAYSEPANFSAVLPMMFTMRHVMGEEAWHNDTNYANLTIDDPYLTEVLGTLDYAGLLAEMQAHDFVTTIAFIPANWQRSEPGVVSLLRQNPDRYSLVQHGNNHDGYEFYYYELPPAGSNGAEPGRADDPAYRARPLHEQEADILEGLQRMLYHQEASGLPFERVMVFPYGISPEDTLPALKRLNYLATVNASDRPLGAPPPDSWDFGMRPANLEYLSFPVVGRLYVDSYGSADYFIQRAAFDLFIDKPALFWSHAVEGQLFTKGIDEFNPIADRMNALPGQLEWRTLGDLLERTYLEKSLDDGSVAVRMYCPATLLGNWSAETRTYHIAKDEADNAAIEHVTVNGVEVPFRLEDGQLRVDISVPGHTQVEVRVTYMGSGDLSTP